MPKQTFFNLPKTKQETLINAALKEFSRVPLNEALISNIIAFAEIPRGSFYQYFENKEDLYYYLFSLYGRKGERAFLNNLKKNNGDLLATVENVYELIIKFLYSSDEKRNFFKNTFMNINYKVENAFSPSMIKETHNRIIKEFYNTIDMDKLNISDKNEIRPVLMIVKAVTIHSLMTFFACNIDEAEAIARYKLEIRLLREGLYKK